MTEERLNQIIRNVSDGIAPKMTLEEAEIISWTRIKFYPFRPAEICFRIKYEKKNTQLNMTRDKCIEIIKEIIKKCDEDNLKWPGSESWYEGKKRGLLDALELIGMVNNEQNK